MSEATAGDPGEAKGEATPREPFHPLPSTPLPPREPKKKSSELVRRTLTAAVLVPTVLYIIVLGGIPYLVTVMIFTLLGQREFYKLIEDKGAQPLTGLGLAAGAALPVVAYFGTAYQATLLLTASLLGFMVAQLRKAEISEALASISGTFFGVFYVGWLLSHAVALRFFSETTDLRYGAPNTEAFGLGPDSGIFFMMYVLGVVVCCDAGAYFAGRAYGRRKLAPRISPSKTIEGALGGVIAGTLVGALVKLTFDTFWPHMSQAFPWSATVPFGIVLSLMGILGDLVESLLKRDAARKDTGALLPGMGGVLDRIDSPLLAIPIMYYMLLGYLYVTSVGL